MSLLDTASLIVTPNGYKEGKLYSVIPSDGSGDLSVTRATTATRVNSAGLVELVPYNLNSYSENFTLSWGTDGTSTTTNNFTTAPNGTQTAAKVVANFVNGYAYKSLPVAVGTYTLSFYVKASAPTTISIDFNDVGTGIFGQVFNLTTEWQRISFTHNVTGGSNLYITYSSLQLGVEYYIWGAQLVEGSVAKDYQKTETRLNIPRLDYSNGTCPSILVEPQRTNRLFYSEKLLLGYAFAYTSGTFTVTENTTETLDPFGNYNAEKFNATTQANNDSYTSTSGSGNLTLSIFAKKGTNDTIQLYHDNVLSGGAFSATFNLTSGTITASSGTASIQDLGNGWFRCSVSGTDSNSAGNIHGVTTYTGTTYLFGIQLEQGNYVTSYIPTTSASVTRNADVISKTGISSLIGQTEGTLFTEVIYDASIPTIAGGLDQPLMAISNGTDNNVIAILLQGSNDNRVISYCKNSNAFQAIILSSAQTSGTIKVAVSYKSNYFALFVNGVKIGEDTSVNVPTTNQLNIGSYLSFGSQFIANVKASAIWKTQLTDAQCQTLTTI